MTDQTDLPRLSSERVAALRAKVKERFRRRAEERAAHPPEPVVYDETFFRVTAWVDSLSYTDRRNDVDPDSPDPDDNPL
jgi:hypothetical protein